MIQIPRILKRAPPALLPSATKLGRLCFYRCVSVHRGVPGPGGSAPRGCLVSGGCLVLGVGGLVSQHALRQTPSPGRNSHWCGRYASYWNAFLFCFGDLLKFIVVINSVMLFQYCPIGKHERLFLHKNSELKWGLLSVTHNELDQRSGK